MGYSCPDSGAGCSASYADFYEQVDGAAWQYRHYLNNPGAYNYWIGTNNVNYSPSCGGVSIDIQNAATAALYIYTPYQPDGNVLASTNPIGSSSGPGPAINDSCAAYGNRNFWWYFNSWFGPSIDTSVSLGAESGSSTIYVLYDGLKQGIPSPDVLDAWGLNGLPVASLDPVVFNAIPTASTALTRYAVNTHSGQSYFSDNGNVYLVTSGDASIWGNFPNQTQSQISSTLINFANNEGQIKPYITVSGNPTFYVVDNGELHPFTSGIVYGLWANQNNSPIQISSAYFSTMTQASAISNPEFTYNSTAYVLSNGIIFSLTSNTAALMPSTWLNTTIGQGLFGTFASDGGLGYMIQASNSPEVYLLDSGTKRGIPDLNTFSAFQSGSVNNTSIVSSDLVNLIPNGNTVYSNIVTISSQTYVADNGLQLIPASLIAAYDPSATSISLSSPYLNILDAGSTVTAFVKSNSSPIVYFLNNGSKLPFSNLATLGLVAGSTAITTLTDSALGAFTLGPVMQNYITNGTNSYLLDYGSAYTVPSINIANAWGLTNPITISSTEVANFPVIGMLSQNVQIPNGLFCFIDRATRYCASSNTMITLWNLTAGLTHPSQLLLNSLNIQDGGTLTQFVIGQAGQPSAGTLYTVTNGHLLGIESMANALNLGYNGGMIQLDQTTINAMATGVWQGYLATDDSGNLWVLDGGIKQQVPSSLVSAWEGGATPTALGSTYLSTLLTGLNISNSIRSANNPTVYGVKNGEIYGIPSAQVYSSSGLEPYSTVSPSLIASIPSGGIWSN
jgi:hypothetical protein